MRRKNNLKKLLNLNITDYTNQTYLIGKYDLPYVKCPNIPDIDYLALYSEVKNYSKTKNTCVCFFQYDNKFDGINGLYNAVYYKNEKLLAKFKRRFKGVRYVIGPDYSQCGDVPKIENIYRLFKSRIASNWLLLECDALSIPNITYANENYFDVMLDGMEETEVVAFNVKGCMTKTSEKELLLKAIAFVVDKLKYLKKIIVYSASSDDEEVRHLFNYASSKGIIILIPNNLLKERNVARKEAFYNGENN